MKRGPTKRTWRKRSRSLPRWWYRPAQLVPLERGTLVDRAADQLRRRILLGDLRTGQRVEGMRVLAAELQVSLAVVREAIAELRGAGLVEVRHGIGVFVRRVPAARGMRAARRRRARRELAEVRQALEPMLASMAAQRITEHRLRELRLWTYERERAAMRGDAIDFTRADMAVHAALGSATGNVVAAAEHRMLLTALRPAATAEAGALAADRRLTRLHDALIDAVEAGDTRRAARMAEAIVAREASGRPARAPP